MGKLSTLGTENRARLAGALAVFAVAAGYILPARYAKAEEVPAARQVVILMRAVAYDANLKNRAGDTINVGVIHKKGNKSSEETASAVTQAFIARRSTLVSGLPMAVTQLVYTDAEALRTAIVSSGIDFLYVCDGLDSEIDAIKEITRKKSVLSVGAKESYVDRGLSLGVFENDSKSTILLNLPSSRLEGVSFASDLLRLARVIR